MHGSKIGVVDFRPPEIDPVSGTTHGLYASQGRLPMSGRDEDIERLAGFFLITDAHF